MDDTHKGIMGGGRGSPEGFCEVLRKTGQLSIRCGYRTVNYGLLPITEKLLSDAHQSAL